MFLVMRGVFVGVEAGDGAKLQDEVEEVKRVVRGFEVSLVGGGDDSEYSGFSELDCEAVSDESFTSVSKGSVSVALSLTITRMGVLLRQSGCMVHSQLRAYSILEQNILKRYGTR